jgi:hypothetical protein
LAPSRPPCPCDNIANSIEKTLAKTKWESCALETKLAPFCYCVLAIDHEFSVTYRETKKLRGLLRGEQASEQGRAATQYEDNAMQR